VIVTGVTRTGSFDGMVEASITFQGTGALTESTRCMSLLEKAKAHYSAKLAQSPRELRIPEWDATVYVRPALSLAQMGEIMELSRDGKSAEAMVMTLVYRLIDEEGKPVFRKVEKTELLRTVDPDVMARVVNQIAEDDPDEDEIEKN
jgi:Asp-tRNAAsn/Glu-tRNAGln amidotransferase B subunit (PET112 homolog)